MKTKVIVLLSIVMLVFSVPVLADGISGDAGMSAEMQDYGFQEGGAYQTESGETVGGFMSQESGKRMQMGASSSALIDCEDCGEVDAVGGFTYQSAGGSQSQWDGQVQVGVFGHADINLDHYRTMKSHKDGAWTFEKIEHKDVVVTLKETEYEEEHETETNVVDEDSTSTSSGEFVVEGDKNFDVHADGKVEHLTDNSTAEPPANETTSETWGADGNLNVDAGFKLAGSGSHSSADTFDKSVTETEDETEYEESTFDHTVNKNETLNLSGTYANNCEFETHSGKTISWNGNGVMGAQVQGGHQSGYVQSTTVAGAVNFDFDPIRVD